jgi:outer membrane protein TolC
MAKITLRFGQSIPLACLGIWTWALSGLSVATADPVSAVSASAAAPRGGYAAADRGAQPNDAPAATIQLPAPRHYVDGASTLPIDLPYALRLVNAANPTIAIAREATREAYARQQQANVIWVPNLWAGGNPDNLTFLPNIYIHNGNVQNSRGQVFETAKANAAFSLGTGLNLSLSDALFAPRIARNLTAAADARARAITYNVQLDVALAYLDLLRVYGSLAINAETLAKVQLMYSYAAQAEKQGLGKTTADANRARTELETRRRERIDLEGEAAVASARLAQLLLLEPTVDLVPADNQVLPIELVSGGQPIEELIAVGLMNRPELAESRALVAAALARWRQDRTRPLLPSLQLAYYGADFGGGTPAIHNYADRNDFFAQASWELRNAGLGNLFQARESRARYNQANLHVVEIQAQVAADVTVAAKIVRQNQRALQTAQEAVRQAEELWTRLSKLAFGLGGPARQYDPIEPLLAEQALDQARFAYLNEVIQFNRNQFRLFWALGQPPELALPKATALPVAVSVTPPTSAPSAAPPKP